ncbi:MAG: aminotransferase class III-fold pyridoxal phosphate-dependent enzyme [Oscillospiraceae bacterium]|jgi:taurine--2-oxoglutarate transaminase|nr:aminotransferase class III-fold pyridoxal phosphate-dependent enzyme [Oscillospiraceae bacterium]
MSRLSKDEVLALDRQYNQHPWLPGEVSPLAVAKGEGIYFYDYDGNRYADMSCQLSCSNLGFSADPIKDAVRDQLEDFAYVAPAHAFEAKSRLAEKLVHLAGGRFAKVFFTCGGSDANEAALNMARTVTGRSKILSRYRSYHGSTLGSGNISGDPRRWSLETPAANGFLKFYDPYVYRRGGTAADSLVQLEEQIQYEGPAEIAAVFVESVTGANGVILPPDGYLQGLRSLTEKYGILLVCDEVMAGFGRTGKAFGFQHWGIGPDIISFAKGVTCGYVPLGGVIISQPIADFYRDKVFQFGLTYSGHALACAAGAATLQYYEDHQIFERVTALGQVLGELLEEQKIKHPCVGDVRYLGLFSAVELVKNRRTREPLVPYGRDPDGVMKRIFGLLRQRGFSAYGRENNINITPPLIITESELRAAFPALDDVLGIIDREVEG